MDSGSVQRPCGPRWAGTAAASKLLTVGERGADDLLTLRIQLSCGHPASVRRGAECGYSMT